MTYAELWTAHVVKKARIRAEIYSLLQAMIKSRTQAGYTNGYTYLELHDADFKPNWEVNTPVICVEVAPSYRGRLSISFYTKR